MLRNSRIFAALFAAAMLLATACINEREKSEYHSVGPYGWLYDDTLSLTPRYEAEIPDSLLHGYIAVAVRHTNGYEYSNVWVELAYSNGDTLLCDTFNIELADPLGRWHGKGIGVGYQHVDTVVKNTVIDLRRPLRLRHIMRTDTLPGIEQIGLIVG